MKKNYCKTKEDFESMAYCEVMSAKQIYEEKLIYLKNNYPNAYDRVKDEELKKNLLGRQCIEAFKMIFSNDKSDKSDKTT